MSGRGTHGSWPPWWLRPREGHPVRLLFKRPDLIITAMGAGRAMPSLCEDHQVPGLVIEVLYVEHCPNFPAALALVQRVRAELAVDAEVRTTMITDQAAADHARFVGSPTVRVDGRDVDPEGELDGEYTLDCRLYRHEHRLAGYPQERSVRDALLEAAGPT